MKYLATGLPFENNDNVHEFHPAGSRILPGTSATHGGFLVGWNVYCKNEGDIALQIWRPTGEANEYSLQSSIHHAASVGQNQVFLNNVDRLWMNIGDVIGLQQESDVVAFTTPSQCTSNILITSSPSSVSDTEAFYPTQDCRDYAIQSTTLDTGN